MMPSGSKALCLAPAHNTEGKSDATGAFQPEMRSFVKVLGLEATQYLFDNEFDLRSRQKDVDKFFAEHTDKSVDVFAAFCHGWATGMQAGYPIGKSNVLANNLAAACKPDATIVLYCCSLGGAGPNSMADVVYDWMVKAGMNPTLFAHAVEGHSTRNPQVRVWDSARRGAWLVEPGSELWSSWQKHMAAEGSTLRLRFPFMTNDELAAELSVDAPKQPSARRA